MRVRSILVPLAAIALAAASLTSCAYVAVLPAAPAPAEPPTTVATLVVPASWSVPIPAGGQCPSDGTQPTTFGASQWNDYLTSLATWFHQVNPNMATISQLHFEFPAGCYYVDASVPLDTRHKLVDVAIDGGYTGDAADSPQFIQTWVPPCQSGSSVLSIANVNSTRVSITGLTIQGSAPANPPYCGLGSPGIALGGSQGPAQDISILDNTIRNTWGDNLYISSADRLLVQGNHFSVAGRDSISQAGGSDVTVTGNAFEYASGIIYDLETNYAGDVISRTLISNNSGSHANFTGTGDPIKPMDHGYLWVAHAAPDTTISDVTFAGNTSVSDLNMLGWAMGSGADQGILDRESYTGNSTQSNAGVITVIVGRDITVTDNSLLGTPAQPPPLVNLGVSPLANPAVCGTVSGNTYSSSDGSSHPWLIRNFNGTTFGPTGYAPPGCS